jgi:DNA-binding transcriptional ArsR family regulator
MSDEASQDRVSMDKALVATIEHPVAHGILRVLTERPASGRELAAVLSQPQSTVGDQLRKLVARGLVEDAGEEKRRGTVERFYRAGPASRWLDDDATEKLSPRQKRRAALRVVKEALADISTALAGEGPDRRSDWVVASSRIAVDPRGWKELSNIHQKAVKDVERVREESAARLAGKNEKALRAISWVVLLELPDAQ